MQAQQPEHDQERIFNHQCRLTNRGSNESNYMKLVLEQLCHKWRAGDLDVRTTRLSVYLFQHYSNS
jgi:hypothetical protein